MLLMALSYACGTVYGHYVASSNPAALACGQQACGAMMAAFISLLFEPRASMESAAYGLAVACHRGGDLLSGADSALPPSSGSCRHRSSGTGSLSSTGLGYSAGVGHPWGAIRAIALMGTAIVVVGIVSPPADAFMTPFGFAVVYPRHNVPASASDRYWVS